jgi:hypothetical protein
MHFDCNYNILTVEADEEYLVAEDRILKSAKISPPPPPAAVQKHFPNI